MKIARALLCAGIAAAALYGQSPAPKREFEVASVKPSAPTPQQQAAVGIRVDGAQVHINSLPLSEYVRIAYEVRGHQVVAPEWMQTARFDVSAKLPEGAKSSDVPEMVRALLEQRFRLKAHQEERSYQVYALTTTGAGVKLKESPQDPAVPATAAGAAYNIAASGTANGVRLNMDRGGSFALLPDRLEARKISMAMLADTLERFMDRPLINETGAQGSYDLDVPLTPEDYQTMLIRAAVNSGVVLPAEAMRRLQGGSNDSLSAAMRSAGLKLESRKAPLNTVVVDSIDKTPSDN